MSVSPDFATADSWKKRILKSSQLIYQWLEKLQGADEQLEKKIILIVKREVNSINHYLSLMFPLTKDKRDLKQMMEAGTSIVQKMHADFFRSNAAFITRWASEANTISFEIKQGKISWSVNAGLKAFVTEHLQGCLQLELKKE